MAKAVRVLPIIRPQPKLTTIADNMAVAGQRFASGSYSWYNQMIQTAHQRLARYADYDRMDEDGDVNRALDVIADEMVGSIEIGAAHQFELDVLDDELPSNVMDILMTALRIWVESTGVETKLFNIARHTIKYGDCFFLKPHPNSKWVHIHPRLIINAIADEKDGVTPLGWNVKPDSHQAIKRMLGSEAVTAGAFGTQDQQLAAIPVTQVVRFSTIDDMSEQAPFGESLLRPAVLAFKQKQLIEDAVIIYRVQRAPERRVFYIDMGNTPIPLRAQVMEQIKNEIKQKKVPRANGNGNGALNADSSAAYDKVHDPLSTNEDYFFPISADSRGSRVETLPGGANVGEVSDLTEWRRAVWRALKIPHSYIEDGSDQGAVINDGKSGVAYIQELKFNLMVQRLQTQLNMVFDREFKMYLKHNGILIDSAKFKIKLPTPQNFAAYRQQAVDADLLSNYQQVESMPYLSKRWALGRFLMLSQQELLENERMMKEELGLDPDDETIPAHLLYTEEYRTKIIEENMKKLVLAPSELDIEEVAGDDMGDDGFGDDFASDMGGGGGGGGSSFGGPDLGMDDDMGDDLGDDAGLDGGDDLDMGDDMGDEPDAPDDEPPLR